MKQITVKDENGREYILEYSKNTVMAMERRGFNLDELDSKPLLQTTLLVYGAFDKNHSNVKYEKREEIFNSLKNKEAFLKALIEMYNEQGDELIDEGNADWTANW